MGRLFGRQGKRPHVLRSGRRKRDLWSLIPLYVKLERLLRPKHRRYTHLPFLHLREHIPAHTLHQLSANIQPQSTACAVSGIGASPEAVKNMHQLRLRQRIFYRNQHISFLLRTGKCDCFSIPIFHCIFHQIVQHLNAPIEIPL